MLRGAGFAAPGRLWLLLAVALLAGATLAVAARRRASAARFAEPGLWASVAPDRPAWRRTVPRALVLVALAVLVVAVAQPHVLAREAHRRAVVMLGLDVSASMLADDVPPTRLTAAVAAAQAFLQQLPAYVDAGLVTYAATATVAVAPTADHQAVARALDHLPVSAGTALGDAIFTGLAVIPPAYLHAPAGTAPAASMVLLSDGGNTTGRPVAAAVARAAQLRVPISTISFGTPHGVAPLAGMRIPVPVDPRQLQAIAVGSGGTAYQAADRAALEQAYRQVAGRLTSETARHDLTSAAAGAGLVLLLGGAALAVGWLGSAP